MQALILTLVLAPAPVPKTEVADWRAAIQFRPFEFDRDHFGADNSVEVARQAGLTAKFAHDPSSRFEGSFTFARKGGPKVEHRGHRWSTAVVRGDVLYFADYDPITSGCTIIAYDLTTGKKGWAKAVEGLGPIDHSKYRNAVAMMVEKHPRTRGSFALVVTGWEAAGAYTEVLDLMTGKQLAHKTYMDTGLPKP